MSPPLRDVHDMKLTSPLVGRRVVERLVAAGLTPEDAHEMVTQLQLATLEDARHLLEASGATPPGSAASQVVLAFERGLSLGHLKVAEDARKAAGS